MKLINNVITGLCLVASLFITKVQAQEAFKLSYEEPAKVWTEALPVGNGSLGAMIYGGVSQEHIQFNEETLWRGQPHDYAHEGAVDYLGEIRDLLTNGKRLEAQKLAQNKFMSDPLKQIHYQPFGDLYIDFKNHENYTDYNRTLDLDHAISTVSYTVNDVVYNREVLSSFPDQILAVNLTASQAKALNFDLWLDAIHEEKTLTTDGHTQTLKVQVKDGVLRGVATLTIQSNGDIKLVDGKLQISNASKASIYVTAATNYVDFKDVSGNPENIVAETIAEVDAKKYKKVKNTHIKDYQGLYNRFELSFGDNGKSANPTNQRLQEFSEDPNDPQFVALYVAYARYLTISCSRPGTKPGTLQGIWNDKLTPPWFSSYTTNINLEMNYWPVESG